MKLRWPCKEHVRYDSHYIKGGDRDGMLCPGGVFLPDDTLDRVEMDEDGDVRRIRPNDPHKYGTKVAWSWTDEDEKHQGYWLVPLDALSVREAEPDPNQLEVPFTNRSGMW